MYAQSLQSLFCSPHTLYLKRSIKRKKEVGGRGMRWVRVRGGGGVEEMNFRIRFHVANSFNPFLTVKKVICRMSISSYLHRHVLVLLIPFFFLHLPCLMSGRET